MKKSFLIVLSLGLVCLLALGLAGCVRPRPNPTTPVPTQLSLNPTEESTAQATQTASEGATPEGEATATGTEETPTVESAPTTELAESTPEPTEPTEVPPTEVPPTEAPTVAPADPGTSGGTAGASGSTYEVRWGDTLSGIARRFNTTVEAILSANPWITNRNFVPAGKHLAVTAGATSGGSTGSSSGQSYRVQYGDTLTGIARRFNTTVWDIAVRNNIGNQNMIYAGQVLIIP